MNFGDWGEWHTMWSHYPWPSPEKKREVLQKAIDAYVDVLASNQPANYDLRIALVDASETPSVRLGIVGADDQNRYKLGAVTISDERK